MVLSASVDLWIPIVLAIVLGLVPAILALRIPTPSDPRRRLELARDA
jgi:hypothetical protein